jgi:hypothetical protein
MPSPARLSVASSLSALALAWCLVGCPVSDDDDLADDDDVVVDDDDSAVDDDDSGDDDDAVVDDDDSGADDDDSAMPVGERAVSGKAYFFDAAGVGQIEELDDVEGAEVFLLEYPAYRIPLAADGLFSFEGLPDDSVATVGLDHPDFVPALTATLPITDEDVANVTFQGVSWAIGQFLGLMLSIDPEDTTVCHMVVTVTSISDNQGSVYAPGEPGVVVTIDPPVAPEHGPWYFNTSVVPDDSLTSTTTDGGVVVAGVQPGVYTWTATKDGVEFEPRVMTCVGGRFSNASPPHGMQALEPGGR